MTSTCWRFRRSSAPWLLACLAVACAPEPTADRFHGPSLAKGGNKPGGSGGDPTVAAVSPSFGRQGQALSVRISGSGYDNTAVASWERDGLPDPKILVTATRFLSSTELEADIEIAADAEIDLYSVAVKLGSGKRGVGIESFEVTTAVVVGSFCSTGAGFSNAFGANDQGAIVGVSCDLAFFWEPGGGITSLGSRVASHVDQASLLVAGQAVDRAAIWTRSAIGSAWSGPTILPANGWTGRANRVVSDIQGTPFILGGRVDRPTKGKNTLGEPAIWLRNGSGWRLVILPRPAGMSTSLLPIFGLATNGSAVSRFSNAVWEPSSPGSDQYAVSLLPGGGNARGISPNGEWIVGVLSSGISVYWRRGPGGAWAGPFALNSSCTAGWANDVNDHGVVVGRGCSGGAAWKVHDDGSVEEIRLSGLGMNDASQEAWGVNNVQPARAAGNGIKSAVYWDLPW